jgi:hypothetical protein
MNDDGFYALLDDMLEQMTSPAEKHALREH